MAEVKIENEKAVTKPAREKKEKTVTIRLPLTREEKDGVPVGVNGRTWLIKRGVDVEVPACVAEVLRNREKMLSEAMAFEDQASEKADQ